LGAIFVLQIDERGRMSSSAASDHSVARIIQRWITDWASGLYRFFDELVAFEAFSRVIDVKSPHFD
jgi:hypothetical protein